MDIQYEFQELVINKLLKNEFQITDESKLNNKSYNYFLERPLTDLDKLDNTQYNQINKDWSEYEKESIESDIWYYQKQYQKEHPELTKQQVTDLIIKQWQQNKHDEAYMAFLKQLNLKECYDITIEVDDEKFYITCRYFIADRWYNDYQQDIQYLDIYLNEIDKLSLLIPAKLKNLNYSIDLPQDKTPLLPGMDKFASVKKAKNEQNDIENEQISKKITELNSLKSKLSTLKIKKIKQLIKVSKNIGAMTVQEVIDVLIEAANSK